MARTLRALCFCAVCYGVLSFAAEPTKARRDFTAREPELTWQIQLIALAMLGIALLMLWQRPERPSRNRNEIGDQPFPTSRHPNAFVGRVFRLQKPIVDGVGVVTICGTLWRVEGRDCSAGKRIKVVRAEGTLLVVDPFED